MQLQHLAEVEQKLRMAQPILAVPPRSAYTIFATEIHRYGIHVLLSLLADGEAGGRRIDGATGCGKESFRSGTQSVS